MKSSPSSAVSARRSPRPASAIVSRWLGRWRWGSVSFDSGRGRVRSLNKGVNPSPQLALCPLADPAAIDVERQLGPALDENDAGIDRAQADHPRKWAVLDQIVDDPAL